MGTQGTYVRRIPHMGKRHTFDTPIPQGWAFLRCFVACTLTFATVVFFNGTPATQPGQVIDASHIKAARDMSCLAGIAAFIALMFVARHRPQSLHPVALSVAAVVLGLIGHVLGLVSANLNVHAFLIPGSCLMSIATAWTTVLLLLACSSLNLQRVCVCLAGGAAVAMPLTAVIGNAGTGPIITAVDAVASVAAVVLILPIAMPFFSRLASVGAPTDREVSHPAAFLPLDHCLYVYIIVFSFAYGLAVNIAQPSGQATPFALAAAVLLVVAIWALRSKARPKADLLLLLSLCLVVGGFSLVLIGDMRCETLAQSTLLAGYMCFYLLTWFALCAVATRSAADAIPAICWGSAANYLGILAGAIITDVLAGVSDTAFAVKLVIAAVLTFTAAYVTATQRSTSLDATIDGIEPDTSSVEVRYIDRLDACCEQVAEQAGLTQREREILALLARGNNAQHIQEQLSISHNTVKYHARNVYRKLDVHSQQELIDLLAEKA